MENKKDGIWFEDIFTEPVERLSGCEKLFRTLNNLTNDCNLIYRINRYPLQWAGIKQYKFYILQRRKDGKLYKLFERDGMEIEVIIKDAIKYLKIYKDEHKRYDLQKPGGGEMI